jgi:hypothetical protein
VKRRLVPLLGVVLIACSVGGADNSPQKQCEQQAEKDPAVVEIYSRTNGAYIVPGPVRDDLLMAKRQAVTRCMRAKGLAPPGGVQPVQPQ